MCLQQQLPVALGIPSLQQLSEEPGDRGSCMNSVCWGTGHGPRTKINIVADINFSFSSSKGDFLDAANKDRLMGSLITTSKTWMISHFSSLFPFSWNQPESWSQEYRQDLCALASSGPVRVPYLKTVRMQTVSVGTWWICADVFTILN